jgi:hypothetical protein
MDTQVHQRIKPAIDAYIAAAGISVPADDRPPHHSFTPPTLPRLDLEAARVTPIVWATDSSSTTADSICPAGRRGLPRHDRGVVDHQDLHAIGLPRLTPRHPRYRQVSEPTRPMWPNTSPDVTAAASDPWSTLDPRKLRRMDDLCAADRTGSPAAVLAAMCQGTVITIFPRTCPCALIWWAAPSPASGKVC